jgi:hypothetical protein
MGGYPGMKNSTMYAIIFVLALFIIVMSIYSRSKICELPYSKPSQDRAESIGNDSAAQMSEQPVFFKQQSITIIKPVGRAQQMPLASDKGNDLSLLQDASNQKNISTLRNGVEGKKDKEEPLSSGVTVSGKYPTQGEVKEMNSKGIVMY